MVGSVKTTSICGKCPSGTNSLVVEANSFDSCRPNEYQPERGRQRASNAQKILFQDQELRNTQLYQTVQQMIITFYQTVQKSAPKMQVENGQENNQLIFQIVQVCRKSVLNFCRPLMFHICVQITQILHVHARMAIILTLKGIKPNAQFVPKGHFQMVLSYIHVRNVNLAKLQYQDFI